MNELKGITGIAGDLPQALPFAVPEGYFRGFPEKMLALVRHYGEDSGETLPSSLRGLKDIPALKAPSGYFDGLPGQVLARIHALDKENADPELSHMLQGLRAQAAFLVPSGYFERFPEEMLARAKSLESVDEELQRLSPLLAGMTRKYPGSVPHGYFERLSPIPAGIEAPLHELPNHAAWIGETPVVSIRPQARRSVHPLLAAAVTIGVVLISAVWGYHIALKPTPFIRSGINLKTPAQLNSAMATVSDQVIVDYLKNSSDISEDDLLAASEVDDQLINKPDESPEGSKIGESQTIPE